MDCNLSEETNPMAMDIPLPLGEGLRVWAKRIYPRLKPGAKGAFNSLSPSLSLVNGTRERVPERMGKRYPLPCATCEGGEQGEGVL